MEFGLIHLVESKSLTVPTHAVCLTYLCTPGSAAGVVAETGEHTDSF
jgi:hypothetical protein